jgi:hypothetical protein
MRPAAFIESKMNMNMAASRQNTLHESHFSNCHQELSI